MAATKILMKMEETDQYQNDLDRHVMTINLGVNTIESIPGSVHLWWNGSAAVAYQDSS